LEQQGAELHHHQVVADLHHQVHVMLHEQDAHAFTLQLTQHIGHEVLLFFVTQARSGFVQQQQGGVGTQGAGDFHQAVAGPWPELPACSCMVLANADALELLLREPLEHALFFIDLLMREHARQHTPL
jgi:hypothetical protein